MKSRIAIITLFWACSHAAPCGSGMAIRSHTSAEERWATEMGTVKRYAEIVDSATEPYETAPQVIEAIEFFQKVTGVRSEANFGPAGMSIRAKDLHEAIAQWQKWHRQYGDRLRVDDENHVYVARCSDAA